MKIDLTGKTAIVTGSTEGIGYGTALGLAQSGAEVVINGRTQEKVDHAVAKLKAAVPDAKVKGVAADVSTAKGCDTLVAAVPRADILVNNAGIFELKPFFDIPDEEWEHYFQTNVMSGVRLSRAYLKGMMERNWGRIVFLSSESGINIPPEMLHYGFTRTAVLGISRGLAKLAHGTGVTVNAVLPGPTLSEGVGHMIEKMAKESGKPVAQVEKEFVPSIRPTSIIERIASVEEVANMIVYACSPQASATTGAALRVDGGVVESII
ncbi:SDR family NAD(P)-dependent oxidoreductase [Methyloferula stellata]|uniref:SDR family NAD(P)-dependent oxidoreductase n=1 Tax=Methyloferula stellata TaxID=876270 RepID=UPI0003607293|nr:SDR family NAD(P)-dependent oxidoreductase [Methyloferula stellata]